MTGSTNITGINMCRRFTGCVIAIVTTAAIVHYTGMTEYSTRPIIRGMADIT